MTTDGDLRGGCEHRGGACGFRHREPEQEGPSLGRWGRAWDAGAEPGTLEAIYKALRALGNKDLDALMANVTKLTVTGLHDGQPSFCVGRAV